MRKLLIARHLATTAALALLPAVLFAQPAPSGSESAAVLLVQPDPSGTNPPIVRFSQTGPDGGPPPVIQFVGPGPGGGGAPVVLFSQPNAGAVNFGAAVANNGPDSAAEAAGQIIQQIKEQARMMIGQDEVSTGVPDGAAWSFPPAFQNALGGNPDPAQLQQQVQMMQQRMTTQYRDALGITNDTEWGAIQELIQKVMDAQREANKDVGLKPASIGGGAMFIGRQSSDEEQALQKTMEDNTAPGELRAALAKFRAAHKAKLDKLAAAQEDLRKCLTTKQEVTAVLMGLLP